jgi:lysozyme
MAVDNRAVGIDVSLWQPNVDWVALKKAGVNFAFAKATEADNITDPQFAKNWPAMKAAGVVRGAYHFFRPGKDPLKQAALFTQVAKLEAGDLPLALDLESNGGLAPAPLVQTIKACLDEIERLSGRRPMVYTGPNFWNTSVCVPNAPDWSANYPLWIANYTAASGPTVPKGWAAWDFWQYTDHGKFDGIPTTFDMDRYKGSLADLLAWLGAAAPAQPTAPIPDPAGQLMTHYIQALNVLDFDGLVALYQPDATRTAPAPSGTVQGADALRSWYQAFLTNQYPNGVFTLGDVTPISTTSCSFIWTCHSAQGDAKGVDTIGLRDNKIAYHSTSY